MELHLPPGEAPNRIDIQANRKIEAVLIPFEGGFIAAGIQIAAFGFGPEIDDALEALVKQCAEIEESCADYIGTDLAFVYGTPNHVFRFLANLPIEERVMPLEIMGHA